MHNQMLCENNHRQERAVHARKSADITTARVLVAEKEKDGKTTRPNTVALRSCRNIKFCKKHGWKIVWSEEEKFQWARKWRPLAEQQFLSLIRGKRKTQMLDMNRRFFDFSVHNFFGDSGDKNILVRHFTVHKLHSALRSRPRYESDVYKKQKQQQQTQHTRKKMANFLHLRLRPYFVTVWKNLHSPAACTRLTEALSSQSIRKRGSRME